MKIKSVYTLIGEFRGGTYITQVHCDNVFDACKLWTDKLEEQSDEIKFLGAKVLKEVKASVHSSNFARPTKIEGVKNVWYTIILTKRGSIHLNIIKTSK